MEEETRAHRQENDRVPSVDMLLGHLYRFGSPGALCSQNSSRNHSLRLERTVRQKAVSQVRFKLIIDIDVSFNSYFNALLFMPLNLT